MIIIYNEDDFLNRYQSDIVLVKKVGKIEKIVPISKIDFKNHKQDFDKKYNNNKSDDFSSILEEQIKKMK